MWVVGSVGVFIVSFSLLLGYIIPENELNTRILLIYFALFHAIVPRDKGGVIDSGAGHLTF